MGEAELKDPLPWDQVPPSDFAREDHVSPFMDELQARSAARVAKDKDFDYLREDIAQFKKVLAIKTVSLNEADRRQEMNEAKAREESRNHERAARKESQPTTYDITVNNADSPGLPAPTIAKHLPMAKLTAPPADEAEDVDASVPQSDPILRETERILVDYAAMLRHPATLAVAAH